MTRTRNQNSRAEPLRTVTIGLRPLRAYASPRSQPDHPWASFDDLATMAEWDEDERRDRWDQMRRELPEMGHAMPDGTPLIAEPMVGGLFMAWVLMGCEPAQTLLDEWLKAWTEIFAEQLAHLSRPEWLKAVEGAELRNIPMVPA